MSAVSSVLACLPKTRVAELLHEAILHSERDSVRSATCKAYLEELAGDVHRCRALIFPSVGLTLEDKNNSFGKWEERTIQVSHKQTPAVDEKLRPYIIPIADQGVADFYFINIRAKGNEPAVFHIQLDPDSENVVRIPSREVFLHETYVGTYKDLPWDGSVVVPETRAFLPKSLAPELPSIAKDKTADKKTA